MVAVDALGYVDLSAATWEWSVDAYGPQPTLVTVPEASGPERSATFTFTGDANATFECAVDDGPVEECSSPYTVNDLFDGEHSFELTAVVATVPGTAVVCNWTVVDVAPVAFDQEVVVAADVGLGQEITLVADDVDEVVYRIVDAPDHGFLEGTPPEVTYVPFDGYRGPDSFVFEADDGQISSNEATVAVFVTAFDLAPVIDLPGAVVSANTDPGSAFATVTYAATAIDPDSIEAAFGDDVQGLFGATVEVDCTPRSGSSFVIGNSTVTCTATDIDTNTATATFVVRVRDNELPGIVSPGNQTVTALEPGSDLVVFDQPTATDNSGSVTVICQPASGTALPIGATTVQCSATDPSANSVSTSFVVVREATATVPGSNLPATGNGSLPLRQALVILLAGLVLVIIARRRRNAII